MPKITGEEAVELLRGGPEGVAKWNCRRDQGDEIPDLAPNCRAYRRRYNGSKEPNDEHGVV